MHLSYDDNRKIIHISKMQHERRTNFSLLNKQEKEDVLNYLKHGMREDLENEIFPFLNEEIHKFKPDFNIKMFNYYVEGLAENQIDNNDGTILDGIIDSTNNYQKSLIPGFMITYTGDQRDLSQIHPTDINYRNILFSLVIPNDDCVFEFYKKKVLLQKQLETKEGLYKADSASGTKLILYINNNRLIFSGRVIEFSGKKYDIQVLIFKLFYLETQDENIALEKVQDLFGRNSLGGSDLAVASSPLARGTSGEDYDALIAKIYGQKFDDRTIKYIANCEYIKDMYYCQNEQRLQITKEVIDSMNYGDVLHVYKDKVQDSYIAQEDAYFPCALRPDISVDVLKSKGAEISRDENGEYYVSFPDHKVNSMLPYLQALGSNTYICSKGKQIVFLPLFIPAKKFMTTPGILDANNFLICCYANEMRVFNYIDNYIADYDAAFNKKCITAKELFRRAFIRASKQLIKNRRAILRKLVNNPRTLLNNGLINKEEKSTFSYIFKGVLSAMIEIWMKRFRCYTQLDVNSLINLSSYMSDLRKIITFIRNKEAISDSQRYIHNTMLNRIDFIEVPTSHKIGVTNQLAAGCNVQEDGTMKVDYFKVVNGIVTDEIVSMDAVEESDYVLAQYADVDIDDNGKITNIVLARVPSVVEKFKMEMQYVKPEEINFITTSMDSALGFGTATIPFMGSNDTARCTFGVNQSKQAKTLISSEKPIIMTDAYTDVVTEQFSKYRITSNDLKYKPHYTISDNSFIYYNNLFDYEKMEDQGLLNLKMDTDQLETNIIKDGVYQIGTNALIGYIPTGSNYEDAVSISERLAFKLSSYRIERKTYQDMNINDSEVGMIEYGTKKRGSIISNLKTKSGSIRSLVMNKTESGALINKYTRPEKDGGKSLVFDFMFINPMTSGDKITNRHGNKGVKAFDQSGFKCKNENMPRLANGEFLDIAYNSLGVMTRMNYGQIKEAQLGLIGYILGVSFQFSASYRLSIDNLNELKTKLYRLINADNFDSELKTWNLSEEFYKHVKGRETFIKSWKEVLNPNLTAKIFDPITRAVLINDAIIGVNYVYKMVQESTIKINSRGGVLSNQSYDLLRACPVEGGSVTGGQKLGNMELDALMAYGADHLIFESLNIKGDNPAERQRFYYEMYGTKHKEIPRLPRRSTTNLQDYLLGMGIGIKAGDFIDTQKLGPTDYPKYNNRTNKYQQEDDVSEETFESYPISDYYLIAALTLNTLTNSTTPDAWVQQFAGNEMSLKIMTIAFMQELGINETSFHNILKAPNMDNIQMYSSFNEYLHEYSGFDYEKIKRIYSDLIQFNHRRRNSIFGVNFLKNEGELYG